MGFSEGGGGHSGDAFGSGFPNKAQLKSPGQWWRTTSSKQTFKPEPSFAQSEKRILPRLQVCSLAVPPRSTVPARVAHYQEIVRHDCGREPRRTLKELNAADKGKAVAGLRRRANHRHGAVQSRNTTITTKTTTRAPHTLKC